MARSDRLIAGITIGFDVMGYTATPIVFDLYTKVEPRTHCVT
jgi:hypothetical protein